MRLSKHQSREIAKQAMEPRKEAWQAKVEALKKEVDREVLNKVPPSVLKLWEGEHKNYVTTRSLFQFTSGETKRYEQFSSSKFLPANSNWVELSDPGRLDKLLSLQQEITDLSTAYKNDLDTLDLAIQNLRTLKRVAEELPELVRFFPKDANTALALPLENIRQIIKSNEKGNDAETV